MELSFRCRRQHLRPLVLPRAADEVGPISAFHDVAQAGHPQGREGAVSSLCNALPLPSLVQLDVAPQWSEPGKVQGYPLEAFRAWD